MTARVWGPFPVTRWAATSHDLSLEVNQCGGSMSACNTIECVQSSKRSSHSRTELPPEGRRLGCLRSFSGTVQHSTPSRRSVPKSARLLLEDNQFCHLRSPSNRMECPDCNDIFLQSEVPLAGQPSIPTSGELRRHHLANPLANNEVFRRQKDDLDTLTDLVIPQAVRHCEKIALEVVLSLAGREMVWILQKLY